MAGRVAGRRAQEGETEMKNGLNTERLARTAAGHPWLTLGAWLLVLVGAFLLAGNLNFTSEGGVATTDARRAAVLIEEATGEELLADEFLLV